MKSIHNAFRNHAKMANTNPTDAELDEILGKLEQACVKSSIAYRALRRVELPMGHGQLAQLAEALGVGRTLLEHARKVIYIFDAYPIIRDRWEPSIIAGKLSIARSLPEIEKQAQAIEDSTPGSPLARRGWVEGLRLLDIRCDTSKLKGLGLNLPQVAAPTSKKKRKVRKAK